MYLCLFLAKKYLFIFYVQASALCLCTTGMQSPQRPEESINPLELELQKIVNLHMGDVNGLWVL